jgi:adenylyl-sulfate kinase
MPNAKPEARLGDDRRKVCLIDAIEAPALLARLRTLIAPLSVVECTTAANPDVAVVLTDAVSGLSPKARQSIAVQRFAGARHVVLMVAAPDGEDALAAEAAGAVLEDFAGKLEFASAIALPLSCEDKVCQHLSSLAADTRRSEPAEVAAPASDQFAAHIACVSQQQLLPGREYRLRIRDHEVSASVTAIKYRLDLDTLRRVPARSLANGDIGACTIATDVPLVLDDVGSDTAPTRFVLSDLYTDEVVAAGTVDFALRRGVNVHWQPFTVTKELRAAAKDQSACIIWFTGLSGAGKSTVANLVEGWLALQGRHTYLLDGDNVRHGLNKDLGFTAADRVENIRRVGEVARLFVDAGIIVLCSFISPFRAEREAVRSLVTPEEFIEVHVTAPLSVCEQRDPKGLYAKSRAGHLPNFTGIDSPYEAPEQPDLVLDTTTAAASELAQRVVALLQERGIVIAQDDQAEGTARRAVAD